jgi:hypothetical protein
VIFSKGAVKFGPVKKQRSSDAIFPPPLVLIPRCSTANITMGRYRRMQHTFFGGIVLQLVFMQIRRRQVGAHFAPMKNA